MRIQAKDYLERVKGCWMGKNIGGTLGAPYEWRRQLNDVTFYSSAVDGTPLPNDDLDIQLLWLVAMERLGVTPSAQELAHYFEAFVTPHWAEYGIAKANMKLGLPPPFSGAFHNLYKDSCGSYIRSEIWAVLAPGTPEVAAMLALRDSQIDHGGHSEGTYAAVFVAAMESAAFLEPDISALIDIGLSYIPADCAVAGVATLVRECRRQGLDWVQARDAVLEHYRGRAFTYFEKGRKIIVASERDRVKGFAEGPKGYDVPSNIGLILLALVYGEGDFERSLLLAVNAGEDTDCTAATLGGLFGILRGEGGLPEKWVRPIGRGIVTCCLNLGELDNGKVLPKDVDELSERCLALFARACAAYPLRLTLADGPGDGRQGDAGEPCATTDEPGEAQGDLCEELRCSPLDYDGLYRGCDCAAYEFPFFRVLVDCVGGPEMAENTPKRIRITLENKFDACEHLLLKWFTDDNVTVDVRECVCFLPQDRYGSHIQTMEFTFTAERLEAVTRLTLWVGQLGRTEQRAVPVTLLKTTVQTATSWDAL